MRREAELELLDQELKLGFRLSVSSGAEFTAVGRREMGVDQLDGGELIKGAPGGQSGGQGAQSARQGDEQAVGQEGDKNMSLDPMLLLVEDGADGEVARIKTPTT